MGGTATVVQHYLRLHSIVATAKMSVSFALSHLRLSPPPLLQSSECIRKIVGSLDQSFCVAVLSETAFRNKHLPLPSPSYCHFLRPDLCNMSDYRHFQTEVDRTNRPTNYILRCTLPRSDRICLRFFHLLHRLSFHDTRQPLVFPQA